MLRGGEIFEKTLLNKTFATYGTLIKLSRGVSGDKAFWGALPPTPP